MTPAWQAGTTYTPGSLVVPTRRLPITQDPLANPDFETGDLTGWTVYDQPTMWAVTADESYNGVYSLRFQGNGSGGVESVLKLDVTAGQTVLALGYYRARHLHDSTNYGSIAIQWLDSSNVQVGQPVSSNQEGGSSQLGGVWRKLAVSAKAPSGAVKARLLIWASSDNDGTYSYGNFDTLQFKLSELTVPAGLVYKATQSSPGKSGSSEPAWPNTVGGTVVDNEVTWEGVIGASLTWEAEPLCTSGAAEPTWPEADGASVRDNTINWVARTPQAKDAPASAIVTVAANKVFVGDKDVVRFCATNNAQDWATEDDAGYLPTGLLAEGETECTALGLYRANLVTWTASSMQVWQVDPDPSRMAIMDALDGVGCEFIRANIGVANDLYFATRNGVHSVGITATNGTIGASDVGSPIDKLVTAAIAEGATPVAMHNANSSQMWLFCGTTAFIFSISRGSKVYAWSRYTFPWTVTDACTLDGVLYVRAGDDVYALDEDAFADDVATGATPTITPKTFDVRVQWPWLNLGSPGVEKMLVGCDVVMDATTGTVDVDVGYDENDDSKFSPVLAISGDTRPGELVPVPVAGPSFATRLTYNGNEAWALTALTMYFNTMRMSA